MQDHHPENAMNRRHVLLLLAALAAPFIAAAQAAPQTTALATPQRLQLHAEIDGVRSTMLLELQGDQVSGEVVEQSLRLALRGTLQGQRLQARLKEPVTGLTLIRLEGTLSADGLDAMLTPVTGGAPRPAHFLKAGAAEAQAKTSATAPTPGTTAAGSLDPRLVGRWVHQSMINSSGGAGGFASFTTERVLEFSADGQVQQTVRSVGGGGNWSSSGRREVEFSGRWQVRGAELWVARGAGAFEPASRYRFSGDYLVTEGNGGKRIWAR